jgi:REP element-mobilizing transposase RayT
LKPIPHSCNLRRYRFSEAPATLFITKSLLPKKPILNEGARTVIVSAFDFAVQKERIYLRAFVVMPNHWHALFALREPWTLPRFMHDFMSFVGARTSGLLKRYATEWQDGYYDTRVRTAKQLEYIARYIEQNPVVRGLVDEPDKWIASSVTNTHLVTDPWPWLYD